MEQSLQAIAIERASWGELKKALEYFYSIRQDLIENSDGDHRIPKLNQINIQIASVLYLQGEFDESFRLFTQTLEIMKEHPRQYVKEIFEVKCYLGVLYSRKRMRNLATRTYHELRTKESIVLSSAEYDKIISLKRSVALSLKQSGEFQSALEVFTEIYESRKAILGETADATKYSHAEVGIALIDLGKYRDALFILEKVHNIFQLDILHEICFIRLKRSLADVHMCLGLVKIAEDLYSNLMDTMRDRYPFHPEVHETVYNWGRSLIKLNKTKEALHALNGVYEVRCEHYPNHPLTARIALDIATLHLNKKDYIEALGYFVDVPAQVSSTVKWNPDLQLYFVNSIASIFDASKDVNVKEQLFKAYERLLKKRYKMCGLPDHHKDVLKTRTRNGELLISLSNPEEALTVLKEVLEKRTLVLKNDYIDCVDVMKSIANAYFALKQHVEAFEYYSEVYEIQKLITGDNSVEAVHWESKIREITNVKEKSILVEAVVSNYRISTKPIKDSENIANMEGNFPLHIAAETGRIAMVKFLLFKGAVYNEKNSEGKTPENIACNNAVKSFFNLIDRLFSALKIVDHESIDPILDIMNDTRLRQDAVMGFPVLLTGLDRIRDIIDKTILNARDENGSTPLHLACSNGDARTVEKLLALEVDLALTDQSNRSPRDVAEEKSFNEILHLLDSYLEKRKKDLDDRTISQKNPEMPEDLMDQNS